MTNIEPDNQFKIQPSDVVSGRLYLKLIEDYKEYDRKQKEYISILESKLSELIQILEETHSVSTKKLYEKLERRKRAVKERNLTIKNLKEENQQLLMKLAQINLIQSKGI